MRYQGKELFFDRNELIVSKTDIKGRLTYANDVFLKLANYESREVIGKPHNIVRHENMPRSIFDLLWETLEKGEEVFAYVVNASKNGDHYWVIAHITPSKVENQTIGYHSTRRTPSKKIITQVIEPLYDKLLSLEKAAINRKDGIQKAREYLNIMLTDKGLSYPQFMASLTKETNNQQSLARQ